MKQQKPRDQQKPQASNSDLEDIEAAENNRAAAAAEKVARRKMVIAAAVEGNDYMARLLGAVVLVREADGQKTGLCDGDRQNIARSHAAIKEALSYLTDDGEAK